MKAKSYPENFVLETATLATKSLIDIQGKCIKSKKMNKEESEEE